MRILIICYVFPPEHTTGGIMAEELAEDLVAGGHTVTVLTGFPGYANQELEKQWPKRFRQVEACAKGYRLIRCGHSGRPRKNALSRLSFYLTFALTSFLNGLTAGKADAIYHDSSPLFGTWSAWLLAKCKGARLFYSIQDVYPEAAQRAGLMKRGLAYRLLRLSDTLLCRFSNVIITLSENMKRLIAQRGVDPRKICIIPCWIDPLKIRPLDRDNDWRRQQGIPAETFVALYAGTIGYVSGAGMLTEVAARLAGEPKILLLCVGEGPVKEQLAQDAARRGLVNLKCLPFQPAAVLSEMQATADVGLVTLLPEAGETSVPSKILGYMASERAVIASVREDSPTAQTIRDAECGIVAPPQDPAALAEAITRLANNRQLAAQLGKNAHDYFLTYFSRATCTDQFEKLMVGGE